MLFEYVDPYTLNSYDTLIEPLKEPFKEALKKPFKEPLQEPLKEPIWVHGPLGIGTARQSSPAFRGDLGAPAGGTVICKKGLPTSLKLGKSSMISYCDLCNPTTFLEIFQPNQN